MENSNIIITYTVMYSIQFKLTPFVRRRPVAAAYVLEGWYRTSRYPPVEYDIFKSYDGYDTFLHYFVCARIYSEHSTYIHNRLYCIKIYTYENIFIWSIFILFDNIFITMNSTVIWQKCVY